MDPIFHNPVFIVSPPRSGSTLLFETLLKAPGLFTIGGESHQLIEGMRELNVGLRHFESNRLTAADATPAVTQTLRQRFFAALRDRDGKMPTVKPLRMLEKTPKNSLRIPFLASVFPEARFIYLHRDPRQVLASMIDAWRSGRFRTYPGLPEWPGPTWSLLLVPGWRDFANRPLPEIVAAQWRITTDTLLQDLAALPPGRIVRCDYAALTSDWGAEIARLTKALGLTWDRPLSGALAPSRYTLTPPDPDKWRAHAAEIDPLTPALQPTMDRAAAFQP